MTTLFVNRRPPTMTNAMTPSRRLLTAVFGYLLIGFAAEGVGLESWAVPVVAVLCAIYALVALRATAPGLLQRPREKRKVHPVQTGKVRLSKRERAAMLDRV